MPTSAPAPPPPCVVGVSTCRAGEGDEAQRALMRLHGGTRQPSPLDRQTVSCNKCWGTLDLVQQATGRAGTDGRMQQLSSGCAGFLEGRECSSLSAADLFPVSPIHPVTDSQCYTPHLDNDQASLSVTPLGLEALFQPEATFREGLLDPVHKMISKTPAQTHTAHTPPTQCRVLAEQAGTHAPSRDCHFPSCSS